MLRMKVMDDYKISILCGVSISFVAHYFFISNKFNLSIIWSWGYIGLIWYKSKLISSGNYYCKQKTLKNGNSHFLYD
jgi:hypothetical protein